jgi:hypothetical protein
VTAIFFASVEGAIAGAIVGASRPRLIGACIGALVGAIVMFGIELGVFRASSFSEDAFIFVYSTVGRPWLMAIAGAGLGALFERRRANSQRPP